MTVATPTASSLAALEALDWVGPLLRDLAAPRGWLAIGRLQRVRRLRLVLKAGRTDLLEEEETEGFGAQLFDHDGASALGSTDEVSPEVVRRALESTGAVLARAGARLGGKNRELAKLPPLVARHEVPAPHDVWTLGLERAQELVLAHHDALRAAPVPEGVELSVQTSLVAVDEAWRVLRADGTDVAWNVPRCAVIDTFVARRGARAGTTSVPSFAVDLDVLLDPARAARHRRLADRARETAVALLDAGPVAPGGNRRLVIDAGLAKGLAHEAFGHAAESDQVRFESILGEGERFRTGLRVGRENLSIVDSSVEGDWAFAPFDVNGARREQVTIVDRGVLTDALADIYSAAGVGVRPTGAARCEGFGDVPLPRMSNIRLELTDPIPWPKDPAETTPEELHTLLLERGLMRPDEEVLYLAGYRGGQVNTQLGEYVFNCQAIHRFFEGRTTLHEPAIFSGKVLSTLGAIVAGIGAPVIDRLGTCGKQGQGVPSSGGGPAFTVIEPCPDAVIGGRA